MMQRRLSGTVLGLLFSFVFLSTSYVGALSVCSTNVNVSSSGCWPIEYTCDASAKPEPNPSLFWTGDTTNAKSYCILMDDPVTLNGTPGAYYLHWIVTDIPPTTFSIARGQSGDPGFPGTEVKPYGGPCGGPDNMYRISVYAMPSSSTTGITTNVRGNQIDALLRQTALDVFSFRVTNYRNIQRPNNPISCPDIPQVCDIKDGKVIPDNTNNPGNKSQKKGLSPGGAAAISLVLIGLCVGGLVLLGYLKHKQQGHLLGYTLHPNHFRIIKYQQEYDYKHVSSDSIF